MATQKKRSHLLGLLVILSLAGSLFAGSLDSTFGTGGKFTISFPDATPGYRSSGYHIFCQSSDRIVAAGAFTNMGPDGQATGVALVGLTGGGVLDPTFGTSGMTKDWNPIAITGLSEALMFTDGRLLRLSQYFPIFGSPNAKVVRSTVNGLDDPSFAASVNVGSSNTIPLNAAVLPSGKIMLIVFAQTNPESHHLYRLNADGSRDNTFGVNGDKLLNLNRFPGLNVYTMKALPNGKTVIAGSLGDLYENANEFFIARFDANGNLDSSFGRFGIVRYAFGVDATGYVNDLMIDANGRYTVAGAINNPDQDVFMMRFSHRGKPDATFGTRGVVVTDITPGGRDVLSSIASDSNGKLIVAGEACPNAGAPANFLVARYSGAGVLEAHTKTEFTPGQFASASKLTIQPDGKILVIGSTFNPATIITFGSMWAIARYTDITNDPPVPKQ